MNFFFIVSLLVILSSNVHCRVVPKAFIDGVLEVVKLCDHVGMTTDHLIAIMEHRVAPKNYEENCVAACTIKKAGMLSNGKFDIGVITLMNFVRYSDQPQSLPKVRKVLEECAKKAEAEGSNDCETVGIILRCSVERLKAANVKPANLH